MKIPNKIEPQQVTDPFSDNEFKDFMKFYKDYTKKPFLFLVNDTTLPSTTQLYPWRFRKNLLENDC